MGPTNPTEHDRRALRDVLGTFLTGVTVLTTTDSDGSWRGMTANSFTSVSLDPPYVLVCVDKRAASYEAFTRSRAYAVNILGRDQQEVASVFASKRPDKFSTVEVFTARTGSAILKATIAWLDCTLVQVHEVGDHAVLIGEVVRFGRTGGQPLGYHQGHFVSFAPDAVPAGVTDSEIRVAWIVEDAQGRVAVQVGPGGRVTLPHRAMRPAQLEEGALSRAGSAAVGAPLTVDFLYSLYTDEATGHLAMTYRGHLEPGPEHHAQRIEFVPLNTALWERMRDEVELTVVQRFRDERETQRFGIYSGTASSGRIATIHDLRGDTDPAKHSFG
ncbi:flavin reductase family protein [Streptomyces canus]|uniref:flavin reductase family protein n=1 Tax=Streptomyces canus TaxID=58343 RepID=UPI0033CAB01F